ncbi:MAG: hypothetical protein ACYS83_10755 [Planctomycetota bacterium]|jgi:methyl-accepting chemotaxis protein
MIESINNNAQKATSRAVALERNQLDLQDGFERNTEQLEESIAKIRENQIKLRQMVEQMQDDTQQMVALVAAFEKNQLRLQEMVKAIQESTENTETRIYVMERDQPAIRDGAEDAARQTSKIMNALKQLNERLSLGKPDRSSHL